MSEIQRKRLSSRGPASILDSLALSMILRLARLLILGPCLIFLALSIHTHLDTDLDRSYGLIALAMRTWESHRLYVVHLDGCQT